MTLERCPHCGRKMAPKYPPRVRAKIRKEYFALPRTSGKWRRSGSKRKCRVKNGLLGPFMAKYGITCPNVLWRIVYDGQPWNKS